MTDAFEALHAAMLRDDVSTALSPAFATALRDHLARQPDTPQEMHMTVTPYLVVAGAADAIDFYVEVFGAVEHHRLVGDDGRVGHAQLAIGASPLMLADEYPEVGIVGPRTLGGSPVSFTIDVPDPDAVFAHAVAAGAEVVRPVEDQFHGHRQGMLRDPWGHRWTVSAQIHDRYEAEAADAGFEYRRGDGHGNE